MSVTNRQFRKFMEATGYVTVAEIAPEAKDYPGALPLASRASIFRKSLRDGHAQPIDSGPSHLEFRCLLRSGPCLSG